MRFWHMYSPSLALDRTPQAHFSFGRWKLNVGCWTLPGAHIASISALNEMKPRSGFAGCLSLRDLAKAQGARNRLLRSPLALGGISRIVAGFMADIVLATLNAKYIHAAFGLRYLLAN